MLWRLNFSVAYRIDCVVDCSAEFSEDCIVQCSVASGCILSHINNCIPPSISRGCVSPVRITTPFQHSNSKLLTSPTNLWVFN